MPILNRVPRLNPACSLRLSRIIWLIPPAAAGLFAQPSPSGGAAAPVAMQADEVLGSRIPRTQVDGPSPVSVYNAEEIRATGAMNLADFMRTLPQTYSGVGAGRNSAPDDLNMSAGQRTEGTVPLTPTIGSSPTLATNTPVQTGVSGVSLRGLGSGSTLVLVDGRRVAQAGERNRGSTTGQGFVDLNTIPSAAIERVETITGGASAVYGADALAGVVNFVLKKDFEGVDMDVQTGVTAKGDGNETRFSTLLGVNGKSGNSNVMFGVEWYKRESVLQQDRDFYVNGWKDSTNQIGGFLQATGFSPGLVGGSAVANVPAASANRPTQAALATLFAPYYGNDTTAAAAALAAAGVTNASEIYFQPDGRPFARVVIESQFRVVVLCQLIAVTAESGSHFAQLLVEPFAALERAFDQHLVVQAAVVDGPQTTVSVAQFADGLSQLGRLRQLGRARERP